MRILKQNTARNVMVLMIDSTDRVTGKTGLTLTVTVSKDGGAFGAIAPVVTERGDGWYSVALTASDTDTVGDLALHITGAGADNFDETCDVQADVPTDVWSYVAENGTSVIEYFRLAIAVIFGKGASVDGTAFTYRDQADTKDRVVSAVSGGTRTFSTLDGT